MDKLFLETMTWTEVKQAMAHGVDAVLIPLGAMEQHGPHLPIFTDTWLGYALCGRIAGKVGNMLVAPPVYPGRSDHHMAFAGTITLTNETFKAVVKDYCWSLAEHGFGNLVLICTHGGNQKSADEVLVEIRSGLDASVYCVDGKTAREISRGVNEQLGLDQAKCGQHSGLTETSMLLATCPELVRMDWAVEGWVGEYGPDFGAQLAEKGMAAISASGILGDPRSSTARTGEDILELRSQGYARFIRGLLGRTGEMQASGGDLPVRRRQGRKILMEEMTSREIGEAISAGWDTVCVLMGSIEQHGPHLPVGTDTMLGYERGLRLAERLGNALVAPVIRPGLSRHHMAFPGTITLRPETFTSLVLEFCLALAQHGFERIVLMPTHGGNYGATAQVFPIIREALPDVVVVMLGREESRAVHRTLQPKLGLDPKRAGVHSGLVETSMMLVHHSDLVNLDEAKEGWVGDFDDEAASLLESGGTHALSALGVLGDPRGSNAELGEQYLELWTGLYAQVVRGQFQQVLVSP